MTEQGMSCLTGPGGTLLPLAYRWLVANGLHGLSPWVFIRSQVESSRLRQEFLCEAAAPNQSIVRDLVPFARRIDCDDMAAFVVDETGKVTDSVAVVHLTWRSAPEVPGCPRIVVCDDVWSWFTSVVFADVRDIINEEDLASLSE